MTDRFNVIDGGFGRGGGGPEDPMIGMRVERLEADMSVLRSDMREVRDRMGKIDERLARMEGGFEALHHKLDARPTTFALIAIVITNLLATAGIMVGLAALLQAA